MGHQREHRRESAKLTQNDNGSLKTTPSDLADPNASFNVGHTDEFKIYSVLETYSPKHKKVAYTKILTRKLSMAKNGKELLLEKCRCPPKGNVGIILKSAENVSRKIYVLKTGDCLNGDGN